MKDLRHVHFSEVVKKFTGNRVIVYNAFVRLKQPSTCIEVAGHLDWDVTSVRPRVTELRGMFFVYATGVRRYGEHVFAVRSAEAAEKAHREASAQAKFEGEHAAGLEKEGVQVVLPAPVAVPAPGLRRRRIVGE
jgi:predicted ThiF/HesA family dinucleotide-utilizing enzyme